PALNQNGTARITIQVTDTGGLSATDSFVLTVAALNTGPTISDIPDQIADEDTIIGPLQFSLKDSDTPLDQLVLTLVRSIPTVVPLENIRLGGSGGDRTVTVTPAPNVAGSSLITIKVSDGATLAQDSFRVTFNAVNDPPKISDIGNQAVPRNGNTGPVAFRIGDIETIAGSLTLSKASDNLALVPLAGIVFGGSSSNRTVTVTPAANQTGSANLTITVADAGGATASDNFLVTVASSGNPPQITKQPESRSVAEGDELVLEVTATGDAPLTYQWRFKGQNIPGATSPKLTIPTATTANTGDFDVVVTNGAGSTTSNSGTVEVGTYDFGDANAPPYPTLKPNGAAQLVQAGFGLGTPPDAEGDGQPDPNAQGDDTHGIDDEDGVTSPLELVIGQVNTIAVTLTDTFHATPFGQLVIWIDLNVNGSWDAGEKFGPFQLQQAGINNIPITIPAAVQAGQSFARFRLTADNPAQSASGRGEEPGEVEDHPVNFQTSGTTEPKATLDFGDLPDSYRTVLGSNGARHTRIDGFHLGNLIDLETDAVPPLNGLGDDLTPVAADDEDGATIPASISPGQSLTLQIVTTITSGDGKLDVWCDWNRNGTFAEAGEKIFTAATVTNGPNVLPTIIVPANAMIGTTAARFRLTRQGIADWFGPAPDGEVEDYQVQVRDVEQEQLDFGDAPQGPNLGYPTRLNRNGARHHLNASFHLGQTIDLEPDGQPNATATGDDTQGGPDEDGIFFPAPLVPGTTNVVQVEVVAPPGQLAFLDAWIDSNADSDWADAGEKIFSARPLAVGTHTLNFLLPAGAQTGLTFARFRLSQQGGLNFDGDGGIGEVEDMRVSVEQPADDACDLSCAGTDFWISFPGNYAPDPANPVKPTLCIAGPIDTVVTIENLAVNNTTKWTNTTGTLRIELNKATDLGDLNDAIVMKGVHVTATDPITLYGLSKVTYTTDGYLALPTETLGADYVIAGFGNVHSGVPELNGTQLALTACETNTTVTIIPSFQVGTHAASVPFSIT
ncbi:MAG: GEVED domain-containing protein, partial [Verrucomicrobiales bacterium]|nr:GEVED domain-containing protein [Verrucomicrobiales bacterium]